MQFIGIDTDRIDAQDKVKGCALYTDDFAPTGMLYAKLCLSTVAHAEIVKIDKDKALQIEGVVSVVTGEHNMLLFGPCIQDRPPIAYGRTRYIGEPVAMVIAYDEQIAEKAAMQITVEYKELPIINTTHDAIKEGAFLIHNVSEYAKTITDIYPQENSNIANKVKIRKGNATKEFTKCKFIAEGEYFLPQSDHIAMENRVAMAEIMGDGQVRITSSSQSPYEVKAQVCEKFKLQGNKVNVTVPQVGGAFGGKSAVQMEILAYIASLASGGRLVKIANTREQDILSSPCRIGLQAKIKLGCDEKGILKAAQLIYEIDIGAYADIGPKICQAIAVDCTGPYKIDHVFCDSMAIYTNHPYATAFRGFGHESLTFCVERTIDKLANMTGIDALEMRMKNLITFGDFTPTQVKLNNNNFGDLKLCYDKLKTLIDWENNNDCDGNKITCWGVSSFWKTSNSPTNAVSGAVVTFNLDGSVNLNVGVVEFGQGSKTRLIKLLAEILKIAPQKITINTETDTKMNPEHWKTVASLSTFLAGKAVMKAGEDVLKQLRELASIALRCAPEELDVEDEKVFVKYNKEFFIEYKDLIHGLKFEDGTNIGGQIIGRGAYGMNHLTMLAEDTGKGKPGAEWACGAQGVLVEYDNECHTFRALKAITVIDAGTLISPKIDTGVIKGAMSMGLGLATYEGFNCDNGKIINTSLRTYKVRHKEDIDTEFVVEFVATPNVEAPYGTRSFSEHGIIGIPAAFANALSRASSLELDTLPLTAQSLWQMKGEQDATI